MLTPDSTEFLANLEPAPAHWGGTGALRLTPDPRDYRITQIPRVAAQLAAGAPASADLTRFIGSPIYNQGAEGACVAFSTAGLCSLDTDEERGGWQVYDAERLYREAGGTGANGVDSRLVLSNCVNLGTPKPDGTRVKIVGSYAFVTQTPGTFREEIKASIAAGQPVVIAVLLPSDFGWQSGHGSRTSGYHQLCCVGYDEAYLTVLNSWGPGFGDKGVGSIAWDYLEADNLQNGYCFAYTTTALVLPPVPIPTPAPPVPPVPVPPVPTPTPTPLPTPLPTPAPKPTPLPTPTPTPAPTPTPQPLPSPGGLVLQVVTHQLSSILEIWCGVRDSAGRPVPASVSGSVGTTLLPTRSATGSGIPAVWIEPHAAGVVQLAAIATDGSGRTGTTTVAAGA